MNRQAESQYLGLYCRAFRLSFVSTILLIVAAVTTPTWGWATNSDSAVSFRGSDVHYGKCTLNPLLFDSLCFKVTPDPEIISTGVITTTFSPGDRVGEVVGITYINGFDGNGGRLDAIAMDGDVRLDVPIISVGPPATGAGGRLNIFVMEVVDVDPDGPTTTITVGGRDIVLKDPMNPDVVIPVDDDRVEPSDEFVVFPVQLTAAQAVPAPTIPDGFAPSASATGVFNTTTMNLRFNGNYEGLTSFPRAMSLHGPAEIGGLADPILGTDAFTVIGPPAEGAFGGAGILNAAAAEHLLGGLTYLTLSTVMNPLGEVRGQVLPEPSSLSILTCAFFLSFGGLRRLRQ